MNSKNFPSGPWTGFYCYPTRERKYAMHMEITFANGRLAGSGEDNIGRFTLAGTYDESSLDCQWIKQYIGQHAVRYQGGADHHGIWGTWHLHYDSSGFHIWPLLSGPCEDESLETEESLPAATPKRVPALAHA